MNISELSPWGSLYEWNGLEEFIWADFLCNGVHRIHIRASDGKCLALELLLHLVPESALAVHLYGAQRRPRPDLGPMFRGLPTSRELNTSYVLVHDSTLSISRDIGIGWFEGQRGFALAPLLQEALAHIALLSCAPRVVLWGGSSGGYAALRNVGSIPNAVALVWNPQTAISRYNADPVRRYSRVAFETEQLQEGAVSTSGITTDLTHMIDNRWCDAPVVYLQEADDRHVRRHLSYLLDSQYPEVAKEVCRRDTMFGLVDKQFYLHLSHWDPGHRRPPKAAIIGFLRRLLDTSIPVAETFKELESSSHELLRLSKSPDRQPLEYELRAPIRQPEQVTRVLQWGSQFGREIVACTSRILPLLVTRSILGQSVITAFSIRKTPHPNTALDLSTIENAEYRLTLLRDRRASARSTLREDPDLDLVVIDLLEEVRGTVNAGRGFIVTNHGYIRRVDRGTLLEHEFGSARHRSLWSNRLGRLMSAVEDAQVPLAVIDIDAQTLKPEDWEWLGIPQPSIEVIKNWHLMMQEARKRLSGAIWIDPIRRQDAQLSDHIREATKKLAPIVAKLRSQ